MLAGFTHAPVVELSERLAALTGHALGHAFYASDGASATEIALKMSAHYWRNHGQPERIAQSLERDILSGKLQPGAQLDRSHEGLPRDGEPVPVRAFGLRRRSARGTPGPGHRSRDVYCPGGGRAARAGGCPAL